MHATDPHTGSRLGRQDADCIEVVKPGMRPKVWSMEKRLTSRGERERGSQPLGLAAVTSGLRPRSCGGQPFVLVARGGGRLGSGLRRRWVYGIFLGGGRLEADELRVRS